MTAAVAKNKSKTVTSMGRIASHFGVSRRTVIDWMSAGCPGKSKSGNYDLGRIDSWCELNGRGPYSQDERATVDESESVLRRRKLKAECEWKELQNRQKAGELVEKRAVNAEISTMFAIVRARLEAIPDEALAGVPPEMKLDVRASVSHAVELALRELEAKADE